MPIRNISITKYLKIDQSYTGMTILILIAHDSSQRPEELIHMNNLSWAFYCLHIPDVTAEGLSLIKDYPTQQLRTYV